MSQAAFQSAFARLVTDEAFRDSIIAGAPDAAPGLSSRELQDLAALAQTRGIAVMRKLHLGFRLNKLLSALPLTCRLLGNARLAREARQFWESRPSASFYFLEEAEAFAEYLSGRMDEGLRVGYLADVLAYEAALLMLRQPRSRSHPAMAVTVAFRHDPQPLLAALQKGEQPRGIARRNVRLLGALDQKGEPRWTAA